MSQQKYFCRKCSTPKAAKIIIVFPTEESRGSNPKEKGISQEVIKTFTSKITDGEKEESREFKARQLECGHFVSFYTPAFSDNTENLSDVDIQLIRSELDKDMIGKNLKELESRILFHCDQYQTLLKISTKQVKQAKYAIQYLDQLRERYSSTLENKDEKENFEMKFAHSLNLRPTTNKVAERERNSSEKEADKQKAAIEAVRAMLSNKGYDPKNIFSSKIETKEGE